MRQICEQPCLDCPFARKSDRIVKEEEVHGIASVYLVNRSEVYECEDQDGKPCHGQARVIANSRIGKDLDLDLPKPDTDRYFRGAWEFIQWHEYGRS